MNCVLIPAGSVQARKLAAVVGKPYRTVYRWIRERKIAAASVRRGRRQETYFVAPEEVERVEGLVKAGLPVLAELGLVRS